MRTTVAVVSLVLGPMIAVAPSAHAAGWQCASTATVKKVVDVSKDGSGVIQRYGPGSPTGAPWTPSAKDDAFRRTHFYELRNVRVTLNYGGAIETVSPGSVVMLTCAGVAVGKPLDVPNLQMLNGSVDVTTTDAVPATVSTEEGLFGPVPGSPAMKYSVSRDLAKPDVSLMQALLWYGDYANQPSGTTTTKTLAKPLQVNVTPFVGPEHGHCRQVDSATLTTGASAGHGTAVYH